jgi:hypothetical protein
MSRALPLAPRISTAGHPEFRFKRPGYTLAIDVVRFSTYWITAAIWMRRGAPSQPAFAHATMGQCYLSAAGTLCVNGTAFSLRPAEYECLLAHLIPLGLEHYIPTGPPPVAETPTVVSGDDRRVSVGVPTREPTATTAAAHKIG